MFICISFSLLRREYTFSVSNFSYLAMRIKAKGGKDALLIYALLLQNANEAEVGTFLIHNFASCFVLCCATVSWVFFAMLCSSSKIYFTLHQIESKKKIYQSCDSCL